MSKKSVNHRNVKSVTRDKIFTLIIFESNDFIYTRSHFRFAFILVFIFFYFLQSIISNFVCTANVMIFAQRDRKRNVVKDKKKQKFIKFPFFFQLKSCTASIWQLFAIWFEFFKIDPISKWTKIILNFKLTICECIVRK